MQDLDITNLYLANIGNGGSWVRGKRVWSNRWESGKPILGFSLKFFWGKCPARMTYYPKEARMSWNHLMHAMRDKERAPTP